MVQYVDKLAQAGISSFKIEGRAKSAYYVAVVTNAYRGALDAYMHTPEGERFEPPPWVLDEVKKVSHREYSTGFYFGTPGQYYQNAGYVRTWDVIGVADGYEDGMLAVTERNKFSRGDLAEIMIPGQTPLQMEISSILDPEEGEVESARHPMRRYLLPCREQGIPAGAMLRRAVET